MPPTFKFIFFSLCLSCTLVLHAQKVEYGIFGGINSSQTPSGQSNINGNGRVICFQTGANVYFELKSHWTLISGVSLVRRGGDMKISSHLYSAYYQEKSTKQSVANIDLRMNYLVVPFKTGYKFEITNNFSLLPQAGIGLAYGFNAGHAEYDHNGIGIHKWKPFSGHSNPNGMLKISKFHRIDVTASIGLEARIMKHYMLSVGYDHGVVKMHNGFSLTNSSIQISAGWIF